MSYGANDPNGLPLGLPSILSLGLPPLVNPYPALNLDFVNNQTLDPRITFTRGSQATLFDSTGTLKYAKHNLLLQSQTFQTTWTATRSSISTDSIAAPNGTLTGDTLVEDTTVSNSHRLSQTFSATSGITYTASVFVKAQSTRCLRIVFATAFASDAATINPVNGATQVNSGTTATSVADVGNGWYRFTVSATATSTATASIEFYTTVGLNTSVSYTGNGTSGVYIWGAQVNASNMEGGITSSLTTYYPTTTAAYYAPRFDYNPSTLQPLGLLIEEARTNSLLQSENFGTTWSVNNVSVSTDSAVAPSGTVTADTLNDGAVAAAIHSLHQAPTIAASTTYAVSVFAKNIDRRYFGIAISTTSSNNYGTVEFDLDGAGAVNRTAVVGTGFAIVSSSITNVGNGWFRCVAVITTGSAAVTDGRATLYLSNGTSAFDTRGRATYSGANASIYAWGAQFEAGAFATSYIPTTTTALTRNADVASMTGTNFSSWYNASEGTTYVEAQSPSVTGTYFYYSLNNGTTNEIRLASSSAGSNPTFVVTNTSSSQASIAVTLAAGTAFKAASAYATDSFSSAVNGTLGTPDTSGTPPTATSLRIGARSNDTLYVNGYIRRIAFYPTRLPDATLQALTQ